MLWKKIKNKKGFLSIEAILAVSTALMVILVALGFYTMLYPRIMLQLETHSLAQKAKLQGGLTDMTSLALDSDVELFKDRLEELGYERGDVIVEAVTQPGNMLAMGVTPLYESGTNYIKRDSNETIRIIVKVPSNGTIKAPLSFFNNQEAIDKVPDYYTIVESVMSERW